MEIVTISDRGVDGDWHLSFNGRLLYSSIGTYFPLSMDIITTMQTAKLRKKYPMTDLPSPDTLPPVKSGSAITGLQATGCFLTIRMLYINVLVIISTLISICSPTA